MKNILYTIFKTAIILFFAAIILYTFFAQNSKEGFDARKYVCMYAYYEKNDEYKENLSYFLENAITDNIDYYIIVNGECTVKIPERENIKVVRRENRGFDFGAWQHCIKNEIGSQKYDYYIFLNSSVRGPLKTDDLKGASETQWLQKFLELFEDGPDIKLVGTTINIYMKIWDEYKYPYPPPYTHVQTMFFILNSEGFDFLLKRGFFDDAGVLNNTTDMKYIVANKEVKMSQLILKNGWNINAILPKYRGKDYRTVAKNFNPSSENPYRTAADPPNKKSYFGEDIEPSEVIFYKTNETNIV